MFSFTIEIELFPFKYLMIKFVVVLENALYIRKQYLSKRAKDNITV